MPAVAHRPRLLLDDEAVLAAPRRRPLHAREVHAPAARRRAGSSIAEHFQVLTRNLSSKGKTSQETLHWGHHLQYQCIMINPMRQSGFGIESLETKI